MEVAEQVVATDLSGDAVYDRGAIHAYDGEVGAWSACESSEVDRIVMGYAGATIRTVRVPANPRVPSALLARAIILPVQ